MQQKKIKSRFSFAYERLVNVCCRGSREFSIFCCYERFSSTTPDSLILDSPFFLRSLSSLVPRPRPAFRPPPSFLAAERALQTDRARTLGLAYGRAKSVRHRSSVWSAALDHERHRLGSRAGDPQRNQRQADRGGDPSRCRDQSYVVFINMDGNNVFIACLFGLKSLFF